jgi:folate-binding protein YgfZ
VAPSPLLEVQQQAGGVIAPGDGPHPPVLHFGDPAGEYEAAGSGAAVFDVSDRVQIELTGGDRVRFLHNFCTNDIKLLAPGCGCEAFLTNVKGRILSHVLVFASEHTLWIDEIGTPEDALLAHLDRYIITEDVAIHSRSSSRGELFVCGQEAAERLRVTIAADALGPYAHAAVALGESFLAVRRVDLLGGPGFLVSVPGDRIVEIWQALIGSGCRPAGRQAYEALRIEAGTPLYGVDLSEDNIAQEAARTRLAISFTKGCYLGQEPIARLDALGHTNRELRGLKLAAGEVPQRNAPVMAGAAEAGHITSAAVHPLDHRPLALAMLKSKHVRPGTTLAVPGPSGGIAATVFWPLQP